MRLLRAIPYLALLAFSIVCWIAIGHELPAPPTFAAAGQGEPDASGAPQSAPLLLEGLLLDDSDEPLVGALIALAEAPALTFDHSGDDGRFQLFAPPDCPELVPPLRVDVLAEGFRTASFELDPATPELVLRMRERWAPAPELGVLSTSRAELRLLGPAAAGYSGYELALVPARPIEGPEDPHPTTLRRAPVDAEGRARFDELLDGRYQLLLLPPWARGGSWPNLLCALEQEPPQLDFPLSAEHSLQVGAVEAHATLGISDSGVPVPVEGATILLSAEVGGRPRFWPLVQSGPLGNFLLKDLPAGRYTLKIQAGLRILERELQTRAGATLELGRLELPAAGPEH